FVLLSVASRQIARRSRDESRPVGPQRLIPASSGPSGPSDGPPPHTRRPLPPAKTPTNPTTEHIDAGRCPNLLRREERASPTSKPPTAKVPPDHTQVRLNQAPSIHSPF